MDVQPAVTQRAGIGRFTRCLAGHLGPELPDGSLHLAYFDFRGRGEPFQAPNATFRAIRWCPGIVAQQMWKHLDWPPYETFAGPADLYHFPNFLAPPLRHGKMTVHIYDTSFLQFPEFTEELNLRFLNARIRATVDRADAVFTISRTIAREIAEMLKVPNDRIFCVYPGIEESIARPPDAAIKAFRERHGLTRPYILTVGTVEPRKNLPLLISAFERLNLFDGDLVLAGGLGWKYQPILERIDSSPRANRVRRLGHVPDDDLPSLYAGAELFVLTSFYEGFGLPPVEAMACGTPVICSSGGALPEIAGRAARIVTSFDVDEWTSAISAAISDSSLRASLRQAGAERASQFKWKTTAAETAAVYRKILQ